MISWGAVAAFMGFLGTQLFDGIRPVTQFYGMRLASGIAEAGFFPGVIVYLSHWYRLKDRARAKAYFMVTQPNCGRARNPRLALDSREYLLGWVRRLAMGCLHS
jgi:MFS family permease